MNLSCLLLLLALFLSLCYGSWSVLESDNIQTASQSNGLLGNNSVGYAASATDPANFINYCSKRVLTNGKVFHEESCNGIVMGDIPSAEHMISTIITWPLPGQPLPPRVPFAVKFRTSNLAAGSVTNPDSTLYSAPQSLRDGNVVGHVHVTIQSLLDYSNMEEALIHPPSPVDFVFFETVFGVGDGKGGFGVVVEEGLPVGLYRVCTMVAASNHQPVVMPVVQRGAQDDCQKFSVVI